MGHCHNLIAGIGEEQIAVFAHHFHVQMPLRLISWAAGKLKVQSPFPRRDGFNRHQGQTVDLVLELLAQGKGVGRARRRISDVNAGRLGMPGKR